MYVIVRDDGQYVSRPGELRSYTKDLGKARIFTSEHAAESERCGNETVLSVQFILTGGKS